MSKQHEHRPSKHTDHEGHDGGHQEGCLALPRFERVRYFYGQLLGVREFQSEQSYFYEKHRLHNRYLHGYGTVCGLAVAHCHLRPDPCDEHPGPPTNQPPGQGAPKDPTGQPGAAPEPPATTALVRQPRAQAPLEFPNQLCIEIDCGLALDCQGNEIAVPWPAQVDVLAILGCDARQHFLDGKWAYVSVCYHARPIEPVRPLTSDSCGGLLPDCVPSRLRDDFCVRVSWNPPKHDDSCSPCMRPCDDPCLPLARISWNADHGLVIDNSIRRTLAPYVTTRIKAVSWVHGGTYRPEDVDDMLRHGLQIEFTDGVHTSTLRRGVLDVWVIQGGGGRRGDIYNIGAKTEPSQDDGEFSHRVTARVHSHKTDRIDPGDRVLIQLRSAFILDRCCRAVDGEHIGGLVPVIPEHCDRWPVVHPPFHAPCRPPEPHPFAPWTSGNGTPGGNFESWFHVGDDEDEKV